MAHELKSRQTLDSTSTTAIGSNSIDREALQAARVDLAATFRMAARLGLQEGVCNHFSAMMPGRDDLFLVNPYGHAFDEITASRLLVCDLHGNVIEGDGVPEATAFYIHACLHREVPRVKVAFHTHMPNATALSMLEGEPLAWASQTALKFYGRTAVDEDYSGLALDDREGERMAAALGEADILFLKNHGVLVAAETIAQAWDDLYYLERAAEAQVKAMSTGRPLKPVPPEIAERTAAQMQDGDTESAQAHLESIKRQLAKMEPDYAA